MDPARATRWPRTGTGKDRDGSRVHCDSLDEGGPDFVPAASPRLPRSTSPWPPTEPPMNRPGVPRPPPNGNGLGAGARRSRPTSARFGAGSVLRDFVTPVPRVLLPSRLPDPHHLAVLACPGVVRTAPTLPAPPGSGCPQLHRPAATRTAAWSLTSARIVSASRRTECKPAIESGGTPNVLHAQWIHLHPWPRTLASHDAVQPYAVQRPPEVIVPHPAVSQST